MNSDSKILIILISQNNADQLVRSLDILESLSRQIKGLDYLVIDDAKLRQGIGGNLKVGFRYALQHGYDAVLPLTGPLVNSAPLAMLIERFRASSRMDYLLTSESISWGQAIRSPFQFCRLLWGRALSKIQNLCAATALKDWHGPYRIFRCSVLSEVAFELNANDSHFNTELLLQLLEARRRRYEMVEIPFESLLERPGVSTGDTLKAAMRYWLQKQNLFYDFRYHPELVLGSQSQNASGHVYVQKFESFSPHSLVCRDDTLIPKGSRVLDIGCARGYVSQHLAEQKACHVTSVDLLPPSAMEGRPFDYHQIDLESQRERLYDLIDQNEFDVILLLDVLEHLSMPETFLLGLYRRAYRKTPRILVSTGNVGFIIVRLMLMLGYFNYGNRGILDITHKRLFTVRTFKNLVDQTGFITLKRYGFPLPWTELSFLGWLSKPLEIINRFFIALRPTLFSYQVLYEIVPLTPADQLLQKSTSMLTRNAQTVAELT